jgi:hypothetical protein
MNHNTQLLKQYLKRPNIGNRRTAPRFDTSDIPIFKSVSLAKGPKVKLINISRHAALIESSKRISPGSSISLRVVTAESVHTIRGKMVRYKTISMNGIVTGYQIVIAFDEDFTLLPEGLDDFMNFQ